MTTPRAAMEPEISVSRFGLSLWLLQNTPFLGDILPILGGFGENFDSRGGSLFSGI